MKERLQPSAAGSTPIAVPQYVAPNVLHLIVMPTEKCNFRCTYCYESFAHGRMSRSTVQGLGKLLERRAPTLRLLALDWFGGEPLLALDVVTELQEHARTLATEYPAMRLRSKMTTNGLFLTPAVLADLVRLGVRSYQISVDGDRESHDARRVLANGEGTFGPIWSNLIAARDSDLDFRIRVRTHVDRDNLTEIEGFLEMLAGELGGDERFEMFLRPVARLGGPNDEAIPVLGASEAELVDELRDLAVRLGLTIYAPDGSETCYAAAANSFVVRSTGELSKCTVALQHPNNLLGELHADGTVEVDNVKLNGWVRGLFEGNPEALRCPMKGFADPSPRGSRLPIVS